jgi:very-short-patch-repair endonuclease
MSEYDLAESIKKLGLLVPVLKDKFGNVIDGFHRLQIDPEAKSLTLDWIDTPEKLEIARLAVNYSRRTVNGDEMRQRLGFLAKQGIKAKQVSLETGIPESTVFKYYPSEEKDQVKAEAGQKGGIEAGIKKSALPLEQTVKTQDSALEQASLHKAGKVFDAADVVECERCHVNTTEPKQWHGHALCSRCAEKADFNPVAYDGWFKMLERGKATTATQPKVTKPNIESWAQRKAQMSPQKSRMELELLEAFSNDDSLRPVVTDRKYPIVEVIPDFVFPRHNLAVFTDGAEVHAGREDRDERNRQALASKHGLKVLSITYSGNSEAEKQRIIAEIKGAIQ